MTDGLCLALKDNNNSPSPRSHMHRVMMFISPRSEHGCITPPKFVGVHTHKEMCLLVCAAEWIRICASECDSEYQMRGSVEEWIKWTHRQVKEVQIPNTCDNRPKQTGCGCLKSHHRWCRPPLCSSSLSVTSSLTDMSSASLQMIVFEFLKHQKKTCFSNTEVLAGLRKWSRAT